MDKGFTMLNNEEFEEGEGIKGTVPLNGKIETTPLKKFVSRRALAMKFPKIVVRESVKEKLRAGLAHAAKVLNKHQL